MPYIKFASYPNTPGRQYRNTCVDPITKFYCAEVDKVLTGEVEITAAEAEAICVAAEKEYEKTQS